MSHLTLSVVCCLILEPVGCTFKTKRARHRIPNSTDDVTAFGLTMRMANRFEMAIAVSSGSGLVNSVERKLVLVEEDGFFRPWLTTSISNLKQEPRQSTGLITKDAAKLVGTVNNAFGKM
jgi:hypothetical protein